mmetsp:Transcript_68878/g.121670  ORF Transcript_68878/g.121670 Transcript_68878/m.121670 type:complete len:82 (-) Transcript_68878:39-284(-)
MVSNNEKKKKTASISTSNISDLPPFQSVDIRLETVPNVPKHDTMEMAVESISDAGDVPFFKDEIHISHSPSHFPLQLPISY